MAFNNQPVFRAGGTIAPLRFVASDGNPGTVIQSAAATSLHIGVSQPGMKRAPGLPGSDNAIAAEVGDPIHVYGIGDVCLLTAGGTVNEGDMLTSDATGRGITTVTDGDEVGAQALQNGAVGELILVRILSRQR